MDNITINCHSSIKISVSKILYFDPFEISDATHDADLIFVTHDHFDHFQPESIDKIKKNESVLIAPKSMEKDILAKSGIAKEQCVFLEPAQSDCICDLDIKAIPAYNIGKPFHTRGKNFLGYVVCMDDTNYYVSGDTDATDELCGLQGIDIALVPIGGMYTMNYKQAAKAIAKMQPKTVIPTHYGAVAGKKTDGPNFEKELKKILEKEGGAVDVIIKI